jgi:hypothetical protein
MLLSSLAFPSINLFLSFLMNVLPQVILSLDSPRQDVLIGVIRQRDDL